MLVLSPIAVELVSAVTGASKWPDAAGVRISAADPSPDGAYLAANLVECPYDGDQILAQRGARVYLDPMAAHFLDDKMLTVDFNADGNFRFRAVRAGRIGPVRKRWVCQGIWQTHRRRCCPGKTSPDEVAWRGLTEQTYAARAGCGMVC